jgi:molybdopterin adenylyltransferase
MSRSIEVVSVNVSAAKGTPKLPAPTIAVDAFGVVGDAHAGTWNRQVSLLDMGDIEQFAQGIGRTIQPGEFGENLTIRSPDSGRVTVLDRFHFNGVDLEVTQIGKKCHGQGCSIFQQLGKCVMPDKGIFSRVLQGGAIRPGDRGEHLRRTFRFLIITLSDRAAAGQYADRSGPRIRELLETFLAGRAWQSQIDMILVPDDAAQLREQLIAAKEADIDVVFTTGGTGVAPRDITPETVADVCDKLIPGIMESIRVKHGAREPRALLSRSIAGVAGRTLMYTLPGSVRAVEDYMEEILKTVEHAILSLHGVDLH